MYNEIKDVKITLNRQLIVFQINVAQAMPPG